MKVWSGKRKLEVSGTPELKMNDNANKLKRPNVQIDHLSNHAVEEDTHSFMASERPEWLWAFFQTWLHTVVRSLRLVRVSSSRMYSWKCMLLSHPNLLDPSWWNSHLYTQFDYLLAVSRSRGGCVGHIEVVIGQGSHRRRHTRPRVSSATVRMEMGT